jgi:xanthine dehydrogenase large subunit
MASVGKNIPHDSAGGHVSGQSIYIDDMPPLRNELIVDFVWSPVAHGRIRSVELEAARSVPGVAGLFTYRDLHHNLFGAIIQDEVLLVEDVVAFIGHPIIVIAAESRAAIRAAKAAIKIDIEELEPVFTIDEAKRRGLFIGKTSTIQRGDVDRVFATAANILEGTFVNGGQDHFYLESQAALAVPGELDQLTVHSSTQNPSEVQEVIAHLLGLSNNKVTVVTKRMGGGFGGKECQATHPAAMAALVAHKLKRPARIAYSKDDDMCVTGGRHPFQNDYKVAFDDNGVITAAQIDFYSDGGAFADLSTSVLGRALTHADNAYYLPNARIRGTVCRTNLPPNTAFRGFGGPQGIATIETILEEIAVRLKLDPFDVRRRNCYGTEDRNTTPYGQVVHNNHLPQLFDEIAERGDYRSRVAEVAAFNASSRTHLRGIACTAVKFGISFNTKFLNQANALVNVYLDGSVQVSTGATEMGQGVNTKIRQIVADEFGIDADRVILMPTSTEKNNNTSATAASSGADLNGSAAADGARKIRARMVDVAAEYFARISGALAQSNAGEGAGGPPDIVFENGEVFDRRNPAQRVPFAALVKMCHLERVSVGERGFYSTQGLDWDIDKGCGAPFLYFTQGTAISEVEIDRFTGMMHVRRCDLLMDIGRPINPGIDRGQITGAFIQGMGWLTNEEVRHDVKGNVLSHSPTTYKIPNIQDVPPVFNVDWIDAENPLNIRSSKAVGEPPLVLAISVWMAVKNALSFLAAGAIPQLHAPATGEEILTRMTASKAAQRGGSAAREVAAPQP